MFSRRMKVVIALVVTLVFVLTGCGASKPAENKPAAAPANVLNVAFVAQPATLDGHWTTAGATHMVLYQTHETLFTLDSKYQIKPMLAKDYTTSKDGMTTVINLRQGVKFHNGKEMTGDDVVASLKRWGKLSGPGKLLFADVKDLSVTGKYQITFTMNKPTGAIIPFLGTQEANPFIYPKESIDAAGDKELKEFIGTGPFQFVEFKPDQYIKLKKFNDYSAREEALDGLSGKKTVYVDEVMIKFITDSSVRIASVEAGESQFAEAVNYDEYNRLKSSAKVQPVIVMPRLTIYARLNMKQGPLANAKARQAFQMALDCDDIMRNTIGVPELYKVTPSIATSLGPWGNTTAGKNIYNTKNVEKAKQLLKESGYKGEPIRWMTSKAYPYMYASAMASKPFLEAVGFKMDIQVLEWAQVTKTRNEADKWEVFNTGISNTGDPNLWIALDSKWPGWWESPKKDALVEKMWRSTTFEERKAVWDQLQQLFYEEVPLALMGECGTMNIISPKLKDFVPNERPFFWNVKLAQ